MIDLTLLDQVDWNFPGVGNSPNSVHGVHWFPGNFIAQIPSALIQVLSKPGDVVFDPFSGSGTTAVEALRLNRNAIASDLMSPALVIAGAKIALANGLFERQHRRNLLAQLAFEHECETDQIGAHGEGSDPLLSEWYSPQTLAQLRYLWSIVDQNENGVRQVLLAIFSETLFECASTAGSQTRTGKRRRHHWGWVADNVKPRIPVNHNAISIFAHRLASLDLVESLETSCTTLLLRQDAKMLALGDSSIDLIVTSPPYAGVIDYAGAHRMLYLWMGWPFLKERTFEIGARYRRSRKNAVQEYLDEIIPVRDELFRVLKPGGYCAMVIGASRKFPTVVGKFSDVFTQRMPIAWGPVSRTPSRRRVSDRSATDSLEFIFIFQKP
ncbi:DNA methyltransferase [Nisaea sp.]|uniref:DNA methyltransferase n=1 Tax=Nisaea sp. TaxID=2024842 RepID=UPI003B519657